MQHFYIRPILFQKNKIMVSRKVDGHHVSETEKFGVGCESVTNLFGA